MRTAFLSFVYLLESTFAKLLADQVQHFGCPGRANKNSLVFPISVYFAFKTETGWLRLLCRAAPSAGGVLFAVEVFVLPLVTVRDEPSGQQKHKDRMLPPLREQEGTPRLPALAEACWLYHRWRISVFLPLLLPSSSSASCPSRLPHLQQTRLLPLLPARLFCRLGQPPSSCWCCTWHSCTSQPSCGRCTCGNPMRQLLPLALLPLRPLPLLHLVHLLSRLWRVQRRHV